MEKSKSKQIFQVNKTTVEMFLEQCSNKKSIDIYMYIELWELFGHISIKIYHPVHQKFFQSALVNANVMSWMRKTIIKGEKKNHIFGEKNLAPRRRPEMSKKWQFFHFFIQRTPTHPLNCNHLNNNQYHFTVLSPAK